MAETSGSLPLVRLMQLVSPALPVGAYAYSQGLEYAIHAGWVHDHASAQDWISGVLEQTLCTLDLPVLRRLHAAWSEADLAAVEYWSAFLCASRESAELLAEDRHIGTAMARLLADMQVDGASRWIEHPKVNWATLFSLALVRWHIPLEDGCQGYLWAWTENQVAAAIKLVPLGQTDGQRILARCAEHIPQQVAGSAQYNDDDIGQLAPALVIGSALHEQQYTRLFRS